MQIQACLGVPLLAFTLFVVVSPDAPTHTPRHLTRGLLSTQPSLPSNLLHCADSGHLRLTAVGLYSFVDASTGDPTHTPRLLTRGPLSTQPFSTFEPASLCRFRPPAAYRCWPLLFRRRLHRRPDAHAPSADARAALDATFPSLRICNPCRFRPTAIYRYWPFHFCRRLNRRPDAHAPSSDARAALDAAFPYLRICTPCRFRPTAIYRCWPFHFCRRLNRRPDAHAPSADARAALDAAFPYLRICNSCRFRPTAICRCWPLLFRRRLHRRPDAHAPSADARAALDAAFPYLRICTSVPIQTNSDLPLLAFPLSSTPQSATPTHTPLHLTRGLFSLFIATAGFCFMQPVLLYSVADVRSCEISHYNCTPACRSTSSMIPYAPDAEEIFFIFDSCHPSHPALPRERALPRVEIEFNVDIAKHPGGWRSR